MLTTDPHAGSRVADAVGRFRTALADATTLRWLGRIRDRGAAAVTASAVADVAAGVGRATRASLLYRWLTSEPDPAVVVVDLRDTWTVGPVLAVLDHLIAPAVRYSRAARSRSLLDGLTDSLLDRPVRTVSIVVLAAVVANFAALFALGSPSQSAIGLRLVVASLALGGTRVTVSADELGKTRVAAALVAVLEPPEPPEPHNGGCAGGSKSGNTESGVDGDDEN